jgi:4a-hydroxytetrahydrobiopterin dehydratase
MNELANKECIPCTGGTPPMAEPQIGEFLAKLGNGWQVVDSHHLEKEYKFKDFRQALDFTYLLGEMAEQRGHHPDINLSWGKVTLAIWTHVINGLTESDFILAAKTDQLLEIPQPRSYYP